MRGIKSQIDQGFETHLPPKGADLVTASRSRVHPRLAALSTRACTYNIYYMFSYLYFYVVLLCFSIQTWDEDLT